jgi:protease-4
VEGEVEVRTADGGATFPLLAGTLAGAGRGPLERALDELPELRALALLSEMGPVLALPLDWVAPAQ